MPSWKTKEAFYLVALSALLVIRTYLSIWLADVNGAIVKAIVSRDFNQFMKRVFALMLFAIPSSSVNSAMDFFAKMLSVSFRERLTTYFNQKYMKNMFYYKMCNLDSRIGNPDQRLTQDLDKWAQALASLYLNFTKPVLDIILFSKKLAALVGYEGPAMIFGWYFISGVIIRFISPPFGKLTAVEQKLEGEYRQKHNAILGHCEEIAFYNGPNWERMKIDNKFMELYRHILYVLYRRFLMGIYDSMLVKYGAFVVGYAILGLPVFGPRKEEYLKSIGSDESKITKDYVRNTSLLINLAKAIGRIVVSYKDVQALAGYTSLIYEMKEVLDDLEMGKYKRAMVTQSGEEGKALEAGAVAKPQSKYMDNSLAHKGQVYVSNSIQFIDVPILSPNGDVLIKAMNFQIEPGMNLFITGPNGCGKSSLFRILGELWPLFGGQVYKPTIDQIFYIPQRPYLPKGTLRDQMIYPHTLADMRGKGVTDEDLLDILREVRLDYLVVRDYNWDTNNDWNEVLSGGEKQRIAMGRLLYHKPIYAIMDECTSQMSVDIEAHVYQFMKDQGITLITVSHRETVWKYHEYLLRFLGDRQYTFGEMPEERRR